MSAAPVGGWVEATFKIAGAYKPVDGVSVVYLATQRGDEIKIDGPASTASMTTAAGDVYPVSDVAQVQTRRLADAPARRVRPVSKEALAASVEERRLSAFGGASAASAEERRLSQFSQVHTCRSAALRYFPKFKEIDHDAPRL